MESLNKEFWDKLSEQYPKAMEHFKHWIDQYKDKNDWDGLFNGQVSYTAYWKDENLEKHYQETETVSPKYHDLPTAMQFGIFLEWYFEHLKDMFPGSSFVPNVNEPLLCISISMAGVEGFI